MAVGSRLRKLNIPGTELKHVHYLKTKEDSILLKQDLQSCEDIVIIGAGFIGSEVAASCRRKGINVTVIEALPTPLRNILGDRMGEFIAKLHRSNGVNLITNEFATELTGEDSVKEVVTNTGRRIPCQAVVIGIGVELDLNLIERTEINAANGIMVDEYCETNIPGVLQPEIVHYGHTSEKKSV
ncbi:hypothetical protein CV093_05030 [Oceanobacillus sp. 143]|nr:hypothetical protein CV093_05030 [Oceanobacillus sp. 143]